MPRPCSCWVSVAVDTLLSCALSSSVRMTGRGCSTSVIEAPRECQVRCHSGGSSQPRKTRGGTPLGTSILGNRVQRVEDARMLTVGGTYVEDLAARARGVAHLRPLDRSARPDRLDRRRRREGGSGRARRVHRRRPRRARARTATSTRASPTAMRRPFVADRHGALRRPAGGRGHRRGPLPGGRRRRARGRRLRPAARRDRSRGERCATRCCSSPTPARTSCSGGAPKTQADFSGCEVVVEERIVNQRLTAAPIEPRSGAAYWTDDGRLVHYSACQGAHPTRDLLAAHLRPRRRDRCASIVPDVGGGFGAKSRTYPEELALGFYARARRPAGEVDRDPLREHGRDAARPRPGAARQARRHPRRPHHRLPARRRAGRRRLPAHRRRAADDDDADGDRRLRHRQRRRSPASSVVTNAVSTTAYRGAGRPEAAVAIERMVDRFAAEIGMDPAEVRRRNFVPRFIEPLHDRHRHGLRRRRLPRGARAGARPPRATTTLRAEQARAPGRRTIRSRSASGIAVYVEITAGAPGSEFGAVELLDGGRIRVRSGATPFGQGHDTTWAMIVADRTGVPIEHIEVVHGDTDQVPRGRPHRRIALGAARRRGDRHRDRHARRPGPRARRRPARGAPSTTSCSTTERGRVPRRRHARARSSTGPTWPAPTAKRWQAEYDFTPVMPTFPFGAHSPSSRSTPRRAHARLAPPRRASTTPGKILNPLLAEGQVHGGIAQGVAQALLRSRALSTTTASPRPRTSPTTR